MPNILLHLLPASMYAALGVHSLALPLVMRQRYAKRRGLSGWERGALLLALAAGCFHRELFAAGGMRFGSASRCR